MVQEESESNTKAKGGAWTMLGIMIVALVFGVALRWLAPNLSEGADLRSPGVLSRWVFAGVLPALLENGSRLFLSLLKFLVVPLVVISILSGIGARQGTKGLGRVAWATTIYYMASSLLAILVGQFFVSILAPGWGAKLALEALDASTLLAKQEGAQPFVERLVPSNFFEALSDNGAMLQLIFASILLSLALLKTPSPHRERIQTGVETLNSWVSNLATLILKLLPFGVFIFTLRAVFNSGVEAFQSLGFFMFVVAISLGVHACVTIPLLITIFGDGNPWAWAKAMRPALETAFGTSSSSATLPETLACVASRDDIDDEVAALTLPLGATVNMDGTALYECIGVVFLAQYYASSGAFEFTWAHQFTVVGLAFLASVGAAGIPSSGLVMMLTILSVIGLPVEGAALLLAVDRPLDMLRTSVNVWSDTAAANIVNNVARKRMPSNTNKTES